MADSTEALLAKAQKPAEEALRLHSFYKGKVQMLPKCPVRDIGDFAIWYTPGVAAPCRAIFEAPGLVYEHSNKGNTVAVLSDGSRVLGLGDIGPEAGLPVMEGKALLFKLLGGVDAVPLCIRAREPDDVLRAARLIEPSFGAINLEDIAQPRCFRILEAARAELAIPVWHDDQQGTATVVLAGLRNALKLVGKRLDRVRIVMFGMGAANVAVYHLLTAAGAEPGAIVACDSTGVLHPGRDDIAARSQELAEKWRVCKESNAEGVTGGPEAAFRGAEVCLAFSSSGPGLIRPEWVESMAEDAIVFACANPVPEIWPWEAHAAGARIVATGRSDFPNQVNNSLGFPGIFRGVLDVRARAITDEMALAAAEALATRAEAQGLTEDAILPRMDDREAAARIAAATGLKAQEQGLAALTLDGEALYEGALARIRGARDSLDLLAREGLIPAPPPARPGG